MYDPAGDGEFAVDKIELHVHGDSYDASRRFLYKGGTYVGECCELRSRHEIFEVSLVREPAGAKIMVQALSEVRGGGDLLVCLGPVFCFKSFGHV